MEVDNHPWSPGDAKTIKLFQSQATHCNRPEFGVKLSWRILKLMYILWHPKCLNSVQSAYTVTIIVACIEMTPEVVIPIKEPNFKTFSHQFDSGGTNFIILQMLYGTNFRYFPSFFKKYQLKKQNKIQCCFKLASFLGWV